MVNGNSITYDAENRQVTVVDGVYKTSTSYAYDGDGKRVQKTNPNGTTTFVYDAAGSLAAEYSTVATGTSPCLTCYLSTDHLGSTRLVTNENGGVVSRHDFAPFGDEVTAARGAQWGPAADTINQKFTGKERDNESGLDFFGARYFGSALGRFTSPDPLLSSGRPWNPQSWNRYSYALNNPLRFTDPTGLYEWDATLGGGCTDKALRGGSCDGVTKTRGKNIVKERKSIRDQLKRLDQSKDASLRAVASAIGAEGKDNGVAISMGAVTPGAAAQVSNTAPLTLDANGNPKLDLRILPEAQDDSLFVGLAHEGSHIWDAQAVASGSRDFVRHLETEFSAYLETVTAAESLGWSSVGPIGQTPFWSSSWSAVDQQARPPQEILKFLLTSPIYASKNADVAYTLGK